MGITYLPSSRVQGMANETVTMPLPFEYMRDDAEIPLTGATLPAVPTYDTANNLMYLCGVQTGAGNTTDIFWGVYMIPKTYVPGTDLTLKIDAICVLGGDAVIAITDVVDVEVFPYDAVAGDFSNADIYAGAAVVITAALGTKSFVLAGAGLVANTPLLIRFTSVASITSAGGFGTGLNEFNFARLEFTGVE
jgi:hypothetical protein